MFKMHKLTFSACSVVMGLAAVGCGSAPDQGQPSDAVSAGPTLQATSYADQHTAPVPSPTLAVPSGNRLAFHYDAIGWQIYGCQKVGAGYGWVFLAPEATLYGENGQVKGKHYAGPTWEGNDGSTVVGKKLAAFTADPTAIPELLLQAVSHTGDGRMSEVTYVQRLETTGGLAPATGCDATAVGATARVDYTAVYYFYTAEEADELAAE